MSIAAFAGLFGVLLYLGGYAALQFGLIRGQTYFYAGINLAAASCVLLSLTEDFNLSSALIQISWIVISVIGMARLYHLARTDLSSEEQEVVARLIPHAPKDAALRLLSAGTWQQRHPGQRLIRDGQPVDALFVILSGGVVVSKRGTTLARLGPGALLGEISYVDGGPATADIDVTASLRTFELNAEKLRNILRKDEVLANALERSIADALRRKLDDTSHTLAASAS